MESLIIVGLLVWSFDAPATLITARHVVFSKRAALRPPVGAHHARRDQRPVDGRRERGAVGGRRDPERAREAGRERADALQADREADVGDRAVGGAQQRGGALEPPGQQVRVRRLAERAPELAAEVRAREARRAREVVDVERLEVAGVGEVLGAQQMACGRYEGHDPTLSRYCSVPAKTAASVRYRFWTRIVDADGCLTAEGSRSR